jgi:hypothetical protein
VIATNEAVDVLRHGWQDAATSLAADVPQVADLLEQRLQDAVASAQLDERHLLDTIQEVEAATARAGGGSSQALARRLRRTVYEYLLALDAARPLEVIPAVIDRPQETDGSPLVGAEEVAALGHASRPSVLDPDGADDEADDSAPPEPEVPTFDALAAAALADDSLDDAAQPASAADTPASRRRFALRRRPRNGLDPAAADGAPTAELERVGVNGADAHNAPPAWQFDAPPDPPTTEPTEAIPHIPAPADGDGDSDVAGAAAATEQAPPGAVTATSEETPPDLTAEPADQASPVFVAPRDGFHIVDETSSRRPDEETVPIAMPAFSADANPGGEETPDATVAATAVEPGEVTPPPLEPPGAGPVAGAPGADQVGTGFLAWRAPEAAPTGPPMAAAPSTPTTAAAPDDDDDDPESRGWGVRRPGEPHVTRRHAAVSLGRPVDDDPFENNTHLSEMRRRIEERLRRKRCDEAAALLQEVAQETGGRAVAELAMNAGDRCRALGKSNAALNCYLAAARSDPVYELPLSRLADICIDNQDTDLAVSYLERVARIYRFREDDRAALRTYRRIATIAPYREDVLTLLMNAERTGQLE